ncbi:MAG TPA: glycosyl hydrolase [Opitutaceae bacterium]|nr:glycosyl hydrolase [Opitutaceae bacterium]
MRTSNLLTFATIALLGATHPATANAESGGHDPLLAWPAQTTENKPWTRWWWPGSAVDKENLTRELELFSAAGLGGVEITPIYGARNAESRYIPYLSPKWMEMLEHTGREAKRLGMKVDMATGTGWPFGGPWISPEDGSKKIVAHDGQLSGTPTSMKVKRAAPGGEGLVIDPFSTTALDHYLAPFTKAFAHFPRNLVRSQFHDSFEYYDASWTPAFAETFHAMHGYDLNRYADALLGHASLDVDQLSRLKSDYRETLGQLHFDYISDWVRWSHAEGFLVRNQSHGAPANLLDLYGAVDIPETEVFGSTPFPIPGLRREPEDVRPDLDLPEPFVIRLASSAAHVMGHPLASSETCTWLREHWKVTLSDTKPEIDRLFANGINHIFYHGTIYSPTDVAWPGWFFYASTQFNPNNPWWSDFPALNQYVARVQSFLQAGQPDNEILVYWPYYDVIDEPEGLVKQLAVHNVKWLTESPAGDVARTLSNAGYAFDFVSDAQLRASRADVDGIHTPGNRYSVLIVPATRRMPVETLAKLNELTAAGAKVIFTGVPEDVPGLGNLETRREKFRALLKTAAIKPVSSHDAFYAALRDSSLNLHPEPAADAGLSLIRRKNAEGYSYFIANLSAKTFDGWLALGREAKQAVWFDALSGKTGYAALRVHENRGNGRDGNVEVYLQLEPGQSRLLRTSDATSTNADTKSRWPDYAADSARAVPLSGKWQVKFLRGGPTLPAPFETDSLKSWTELAGESGESFSGTAVYRLEFNLPEKTSADNWQLDLGDVRESARIRINQHDVGVAWSLPFKINVGEFLVPGANVLEIEVTNLGANRIRDLDRRHVDWKIMHEINLVNIRYKPFDASGWRVAPSGLLGPVVLTPLHLLSR